MEDTLDISMCYEVMEEDMDLKKHDIMEDRQDNRGGFGWHIWRTLCTVMFIRKDGLGSGRLKTKSESPGEMDFIVLSGRASALSCLPC